MNILRKPFTPDQLDTYWENLVLALIGETIDVGDEICGCRVVDKSSKKGKRVQMYLIKELSRKWHAVKYKTKEALQITFLRII